MEYISLYRKYRPQTFREVVGQETVIKILKNSIINNQISHAYIFSGPRGTGKTSIAKIFAKAVNCLNPIDGDLCNSCQVCQNNALNDVDIVEIDAASNNGIDEIREIRNNVKLLPSNLKYKVYIIDEVHMLSTSAFNALLKTLEEPPKHVIFILATTEFNKIPPTVISRCQRFDFKSINENKIVDRLKFILKKEKLTMSDDNLKLISELSDGGLRDAINLLDQVLSLNKEDITRNDIYNIIGDINDDEIFNFFDGITSGDIKKCVELLDEYKNKGYNYLKIVNKMEIIIRNLLIYNGTNNYFSKEYEDKISCYTKLDIDKIFNISKELFILSNDLKHSSDQKIVMEIYIIKFCLMFEESENANTSLLSINKLNKVEEHVDIDNNLTELKNIRINNALATADKKLKESFLNKYDFSEFISTKEYNSISKLLAKAVPEVVGKNNIIFTFNNNFEVVLFNKNTDDIQKLLKKIYDKKFTIVAIDDSEWNIIKNKYIKDIRNNVKYKYIDEENNIINKPNTNSLQKSVENIFGDDYVVE